MSVLDERQEKLDQQPAEVNICVFCGREITHEEIAVTLDSTVYDWILKDVANIKSNLCEKCYDKYLQNVAKQQTLDQPPEGYQ
jgi:hypothetical protein